MWCMTWWVKEEMSGVVWDGLEMVVVTTEDGGGWRGLKGDVGCCGGAN